jgi:hypothetical protein
MLDLAELELHPGQEFDEFYRLTERDVTAMLVSAGALEHAQCPGCGQDDARPAFAKLGFEYGECRRCGTVYASPRPDEAAVTEYYRKSDAAAWWREHVATATEPARREKVARPLARWVLDSVIEYGLSRPATVLDLSPHPRLLTEELFAAGNGVDRTVASHPLAELDFHTAAPPPGLDLRSASASELGGLGPVDVVTAFDVLDRTADVAALTAGIDAALAPGGLVFLTAPSMSGFELQVLWSRAAAIHPPDRVNLLTLRGFTRLAELRGWELCELSTPGMFDVETVRRAIEADPDAGWPRFVGSLVTEGPAPARQALQEFLQMFRRSSHARLVAQKPV